MANDAKIVLSAEDRTKAAFESAKRGLATIEQRAEAANSGFARFGGFLGAGFAAGTFTAFVRETVNGIDKLNDLKDATGASIENLSALEDVAARTGTSFENMSGTVVKFNRVLSESKPGSDTAAILKSIGLNAEELKRIDPAEALRQTAVALARFADDGNKARIVQALFGKSIQEVAPFLADLAKKSELVAKVTTAEAEAAEKFNQQLAELSKNSVDVARAITGPLISSLNNAIERFRKAREEGKSLFDIYRDNVKAFYTPSDAAQIRNLTQDIQTLQEALSRPGLDSKARKQFEGDLAAKQSELAAKRAEIAEARREARDEQASRLSGAGEKPTLPPIPDKPKAVGGSVPKPVRITPSDPRLSDAALAAAEDDRLRAEQLEEIEKAAAYEKALQDEQLNATSEYLQKRHEAELDAAEKFKETTREMSTFADQAQRNIQDALGDTIVDALGGDIGKRWGDLLKRMVAEAIAADIGNAIFKKSGSSGGSQLGALLGGITSFFTGLPSFDVGTPFVPRDMIAKVHKGEAIIPASMNRPSGGSAPVINDNRTLYIDGTADVAKTQQQTAEMLAAYDRSLWQRLRASGVSA
jgi:DNA-binding ferritin-like protein (Dps family)